MFLFRMRVAVWSEMDAVKYPGFTYNLHKKFRFSEILNLNLKKKVT